MIYSKKTLVTAMLLSASLSTAFGSAQDNPLCEEQKNMRAPVYGRPVTNNTGLMDEVNKQKGKPMEVVAEDPVDREIEEGSDVDPKNVLEELERVAQEARAAADIAKLAVAKAREALDNATDATPEAKAELKDELDAALEKEIVTKTEAGEAEQKRDKYLEEFRAAADAEKAAAEDNEDRIKTLTHNGLPDIEDDDCDLWQDTCYNPCHQDHCARQEADHNGGVWNAVVRFVWNPVEVLEGLFYRVRSGLFAWWNS